MKATQALRVIATVIEEVDRNEKFVIFKPSHPYYNYVLKLEQQGYLSVHKLRDGVVATLTVKGTEHIKELT